MCMLNDALRAVARTFVERTGAPGVNLALILPDGSAHTAAAGVSRLAPAMAMSTDARIPAGSIGKTYAVVTLAKLLESKGGLAGSLDTPIGAWLRGRAWYPSLRHAGRITLRVLLTHTSGISEHVERPDFLAALAKEPWRSWSADELAAFVCAGPTHFEPGAGWSYGDANYILVGAIIEELGQAPYFDQLGSLVLKPLGLTSSLAQDRPDLPGLVSGYVGEKNLFPVPSEVASEGRYAMNPQFEYTGDGVVTSASDLARFFYTIFTTDFLGRAERGLLAGAAVESKPLGPHDKYGLGVQVYPCPFGMAWGHAGRFPGYCSIVAYWPELRAAGAAQINCDHRAGMNLRELVQAVCGTWTAPPPQAPAPPDSASSASN